MSNKIVPAIYRAVIDDVVSAIKPEFEEYGVPEDVLAELQAKWESKVIASHVADFEVAHQPASSHLHHQAYPPHPMHMMQTHPAHPHYSAPLNPYVQVQQPNQPHVKAEPVDSRYPLNGAQAISAYALPPLPGPQLNGRPPQPGGQQSVLSFPQGPLPPTRAAPPTSSVRMYAPPPPSEEQTQRIPQVDGASDDSDDSPSPPPSQSYAPHSSHPSLPQPAQALTSQPDDSAINSDLDDSDTGDEEEAEEGAAGESFIVFCTYDKVARVKNKWKCILKDGMIHINGRDYLFAKCTGEFEW